jgi:hypothetical protein
MLYCAKARFVILFNIYNKDIFFEQTLQKHYGSWDQNQTILCLIQGYVNIIYSEYLLPCDVSFLLYFPQVLMHRNV